MVQIRLSVNLFRLTNPCLAYKFPRTFLTPQTRMTKIKEIEKKLAESSKKMGELSLTELQPQPEYIAYRENLWDKYKALYLEDLKTKTPHLIKVTAKNKDGLEKDVDVESWTTTPLDVAKKVAPKSWCDSIIISKVDGKLWDLERPLEKNCAIEFLTFDEDEAKAVFWHSTAHVMAEALEKLYGCHLCYGPPIENGFYYDMFMLNYRSHDSELQAEDSCCCMESEKGPREGPVNTVSLTHFPVIEDFMKKICGEKQQFERLELTKDQLLEMFNYNQFKVRILNEKITDERTTVYRCGSLIDLCLGPHVRHTGLIKAIKVTKSSSSYWEGNQKAEPLQRVYGISFPQEKLLKEWVKVQEEAAQRDHRKVGREQQLFFFHEYSRGSAFFSPKGALIYNNLMDFIRKEYRKRGFHEVVSPNIFNVKLWETSGHWQHYADNMFSFEIEQEKYALKPMNCPGHCLIFDSETRSWKDLPLRLADFGVLHRNELSGCLSGLTRVRRFQQDDAHIFCTNEQIEDEIIKALKFMEDVYSIFGFTFEMVLSTRPDSYIGELKVWDDAETALKNALNSTGHKWGLNPGDGAFYGPKIDVTVKDALQRSHQCATIQLDFQLPIRFNLSYIDQNGDKKRPCIIHRALFGSVERFMAILTENFGGKWPFWLSPRQAMVIPISDKFRDYAVEVQEKIYSAGFEAYRNADMTESFNKKVRTAQLDRYNFILVVGAKEQENKTVNVRTRDNIIHNESSVDHLITEFQRFKESKTLNAEQEFKSKV